MKPDPRIDQLEKQVAYLQQQLREFTNSAQIDPQIVRAIGTSLSTVSGKTAASATQAVNESGASSYSVMYPPTGFIRIGDYNVPYII